jgi:hypothetical protein
MTSTSNLSAFKPTYLYIKQHSVTSKLYFGKTSKDLDYLLNEYKGGGIYWNSHISKHGKEHVVTLWYELFSDREELTSFALQFSKEMKIVESQQWANEILENGLDGAPIGCKRSEETKAKMRCKVISEEHRAKMRCRIVSEETRAKMRCRIVSEETRAKLSAANKGKKLSEEHRDKISLAHDGKKLSDETKAKLSSLNRGKKLSDETKAKMSATRIGKMRPIIMCPHCGKSGGEGIMHRWHFDNCKNIKMP